MNARDVKKITTVLEEYGMPKFTDQYPALDLIQRIKNCGFELIPKEKLTEGALAMYFYKLDNWDDWDSVARTKLMKMYAEDARALRRHLGLEEGKGNEKS